MAHRSTTNNTIDCHNLALFPIVSVKKRKKAEEKRLKLKKEKEARDKAAQKAWEDNAENRAMARDKERQAKKDALMEDIERVEINRTMQTEELDRHSIHIEGL